MRGNVAGAHEGFADEDRIAAAIEDALRVGARFESALADEEDAVGDFFAELFRRREIDLERRQVAVVDAEQTRAEIECAEEFLLGVDLDEHIELERFRDGVKVFELRLFERGDDEQHGVRASDRCLVKLDLVNDEILAQTRERRFLPDAREVAEMALEKLFVRQHRDAIRAGRFVLPRDHHGIEVRCDHARARRCFFYFGDEPEMLGAAIEPPREAAKFVTIQCRGTQQFDLRKQARDFLRFDIEDFFEAIRRHGIQLSR